MAAPRDLRVIAKEASENRKIGPVSATYAAQQSCPASCPFLTAGCYAESGNTGIHTRRLNQAAEGATPAQLAAAEAAGIDRLSGTRPLRLHVVGDARTNPAARTLAAASARYTAKHGQPAWTYTHAWRTVERSSWGAVSVCASTESTTAAKEAMAKGYGAVITMAAFPQDTAYMADGLRVIPCPEQTGKAKNCVECRLCWRADALRDRGAVVGFAAHSSPKAKLTLAGCAS